MSIKDYLIKDDCKALGREIGKFLSDETDISEIAFLGLIGLAISIKDDHEYFAVFMNSTGCQGLAILLEEKYPNNILVKSLVEIIKEYEILI